MQLYMSEKKISHEKNYTHALFNTYSMIVDQFYETPTHIHDSLVKKVSAKFHVKLLSNFCKKSFVK